MGQSKDSGKAEHEAGTAEVRQDPPGPRDHGREGGMATRENAPDAVQRSDDSAED
ncbi:MULTISPECIES: hypothetical protein [Gordonia]|uniref:Uncharacterized protein n=1 Tax=Gordonia amicalis TaxID=89053 RepID=A0ABU4DHQ1_9ACTN|nr:MULTISPECIES: hypothetical protein [Gordonia]ATD71634.1 hypothetical protein CNO18_16575 [Gordonia sp. 1D]MBA5846775.1 hypothetical protein [Gordonia amicalis]MDJ0454775.1 hypothetical protein [Gordonia amicalis]MDV6309275.1 hypothetical protein [Gordonia amicalis]MDV7078076.1 hypothetical protein [Gordonia amicalis]